MVIGDLEEHPFGVVPLDDEVGVMKGEGLLLRKLVDGCLAFGEGGGRGGGWQRGRRGCRAVSGEPGKVVTHAKVPIWGEVKTKI